MKTQFVPYEIALNLKELGFDEPCFGYFFLGEFYFWIKNSASEYDLCRNKHFNNYEVAAPLWQQVIDWFSFEHNLHIFFYRKENSKFRNVFSFCVTNTHNTLCEFDFETGDTDINLIREQAVLKAFELLK